MKKFIGIILAFFVVSYVNSQEVQKEMSSVNEKKQYYKNGKIKLHVGLKNGVEHGLYLKYFDDGNLATSGIKINGKKSGLWKDFNRDGEVVFAKQYLKDKLLYELDNKDFFFKLFKFSNEFSISIPSYWETTEFPDSNQLIISVKKKCNQDVKFCPTFSLTREIIDQRSFNIDEHLKSMEEQLSNRFKGFRIIKQREYSAERVIYYEKVYTGKYNDIQIVGISTWAIKKNYLYSITGFAINEKGNSFLRYEGLFKDIINSLKIN